MTTTIQQKPISLQTDDEDIALSNYLTKSFQPQEVWIESKQPYVNNSNKYYKQQRRTRSSIQPQKSISTPTNTNHRLRISTHNSQVNDHRQSINTLSRDYRRPSFSSSIASSSVDSDISTASKVSFSKKLRKVFSMSNIRSSKDLNLNHSNGSISSASSVTEKKSLRRRSIASLSNLFQKSSIQEEDEDRKKPGLKLDVKQRKNGQYNSNITPDSPNSAISSRSFNRLPPPVNNSNHRLNYHEVLPSPSSSSSSTRLTHDDVLQKPSPVGLQYGIALHASPKLRPTVSSSSSSSIFNDKRRIQFCPTVQVHETYSSNEYDRRCDSTATCQKLTPVVAMKIKQELNEFKLSDMEVHVESRQYTHFFL